MAADTAHMSDYKYKLGNNRLGLWLFILSDSFLFGGLLVIFSSSKWPDIVIGAGIGFYILRSSFQVIQESKKSMDKHRFGEGG